MATCSFIKESKQTVGAMGRVLRYVSQEKKTVDPDGREYLSGINCGAEVAQQSFMATKNLYSKASGTFFYHYVQSFSPQENVTPAQAHQIALEHRGVSGRGAGREPEVPAHHHRGGGHGACRQPGGVHPGNGAAGLPGALGGRPEVYHLHHPHRDEVPG